jgi:hypothetical protein
MATPHDNPPRWLLMLTAYLDESWETVKTHFIVAGFLGSDEQWMAFAPEWRSAVGSDGFHTKNLNFESERTRKKLINLAEIPYKHGLRPLVGAVKIADYSELLANDLERRMMNGYSVALYPLVLGCYKEIPSTERVKWVFEEQRVYEVTAREVLASMIPRVGASRISGVEFLSKGQTSLTQPADFLAYATLQRLLDASSNKAIWTRPILGNGNHIGMVMERGAIRSIMNKMLPEIRSKTYERNKESYDSMDHFTQRMEDLPAEQLKNFFLSRKEKLRDEQ